MFFFFFFFKLTLNLVFSSHLSFLIAFQFTLFFTIFRGTIFQLDDIFFEAVTDIYQPGTKFFFFFTLILPTSATVLFRNSETTVYLTLQSTVVLFFKLLLQLWFLPKPNKKTALKFGFFFLFSRQ